MYLTYQTSDNNSITLLNCTQINVLSRNFNRNSLPLYLKYYREAHALLSVIYEVHHRLQYISSVLYVVYMR